jgi:hypothetical protein
LLSLALSLSLSRFDAAPVQVNGAFADWGPGQPVTSAASEAAGQGARGCVCMDGESGFWQTAPCADALPYFVVQF